MEINPHLNTDSFEAAFKAIDTHTVGEFTRIILSGFPPLKGDTMIERKNYLAKHYDKYRTALMFEPRGHHEMCIRDRCSTIGTCMTMEFRTVSHRSSVLVMSLDRTLESFTFRDCSSIYFVSSSKDISFDFLC